MTSVDSTLSIAVVTISSTAFTILFGTVTILPTLLALIEDIDITRRAKLVRRWDYRFLKRLMQGRSISVLLICVLLFMLSNIFSLVYLFFDMSVAMKLGLFICGSNLVFLIVVILVTIFQASNLTKDEMEIISEYLTEDYLRY
jgi:hypothetical protein